MGVDEAEVVVEEGVLGVVEGGAGGAGVAVDEARDEVGAGGAGEGGALALADGFGTVFVDGAGGGDFRRLGRSIVGRAALEKTGGDSVCVGMVGADAIDVAIGVLRWLCSLLRSIWLILRLILTLSGV